MLTLYGVSVTAENARHIVGSLFADGSPAAMSAAAAIEKGVDRDLYDVELEPEERDAVLAVLKDPPPGLEGPSWRARERRSKPNWRRDLVSPRAQSASPGLDAHRRRRGRSTTHR